MTHVKSVGDGHRPEASPLGVENRSGVDASATHPEADRSRKQELLQEALYWDELDDRTAPLQDDRDEEDVPVL